MRKLFNFMTVALFVALMFSGTTQAQNTGGSPDAGAPRLTSAPVSLTAETVNQNVINALASLPEADTLVFLNPQRILSDVLPKVMSAKDLENMRQGFEEVKKNFGVDPTKVEYIVMAVRFKKPTAELRFQPPDAMIVAGGDFSAEGLIAIARMASQGQLRDEKYGAKTLGLMTIDPIAKEAEKNPFLRNFAELGIVALNGNTIAVGTTGYLRAAIDAGDGKSRISSEDLSSLMRDSTALVSVAGRPWHSFARSIGMMGTEANDRAARCDTKLGDFYAALTMDATNFMLRGSINEDNPDTAKIVANLVVGLLGYANSELKDPEAQKMLKNLTIVPEGDEIMVRADFPQQMVIDMLKQQMAPKKEEAAETQKAPAKPTRPTRRRVRRRT